MSIRVKLVNWIIRKFLEGKRGNISDDSHTFDELYKHRTALYSVICNQNSEIAWKSKLHDDGTMFDAYFIAGVETEYGQYTYHCEMKYWDIFEIKEIPNAPKWDGHTPSDLYRLYSLS